MRVHMNQKELQEYVKHKRLSILFNEDQDTIDLASWTRQKSLKKRDTEDIWKLE